jgi:peptidoglycan/LPS O-acetylase OafA/YrhL
MGAIRLLLAAGVMLAHLNDRFASHGIAANGAWVFYLWSSRAVLFFYVVSGFLISYVLHEKYPTSTSGTFAFYRSRFLRIYPLWWAVLATAALLTVYNNEPSDQFPLSLIPSALLFGTDWLAAYRCYTQTHFLSFPPDLGIAWTLGAELTFYVFAPLLLRRNKMALMVLGISAACRAAVLIFQPGNDVQVSSLSYFFLPTTIMFFLLGHFGFVLHRRLGLSAVVSLSLLAVSLILSCWDSAGISTWSFHLAAACFALSLPGLFALTKDSRVLNFCGDLTYPLYLTHVMVMGVFPWSLFINNAEPFGHPQLLIVAFSLVALAAAWAIHVLVENPMRLITNKAIDAAVRLWSRTMRRPAAELAAPSI